ncbi:movement protein [Elderberry aureusvirus 1]|uniref:Movement protein n=1 Tax=Elderberry aureusvirus 1 TaxID=2304214 RepID=A0A346LQZ1_9TOMB|nr:movement protein [Elderberry aureusvirus 1]AXP98765.1 movement protein [Elderberry aureusvirus 1]
MEIQSLDGKFEESLIVQNEVKKVSLSHKTTKAILPLAPLSQFAKWKIPKTGFYAPIDVKFVLTPHISERAQVRGVVKLVDSRDLAPSRELFKSREFNIGHGLVIEGSQLPFCLPVGDYPLQFEVTVLQSQFRETSTLYTTSVEWRMMSSTTPLSRVKSVMGTAQQQAMSITPNFKMSLESSKGATAVSRKKKTNKPNGLGVRGHGDSSVGGSSDDLPHSVHAWEGHHYPLGDSLSQ